MAARIAGANPIIGVDIKPHATGTRLGVGATHTIDNRLNDVASRIDAITGSGVDYVL
jgi:aryl-alcohol dehydrogenase